jgi:hypothetical protein
MLCQNKIKKTPEKKKKEKKKNIFFFFLFVFPLTKIFSCCTHQEFGGRKKSSRVLRHWMIPVFLCLSSWETRKMQKRRKNFPFLQLPLPPFFLHQTASPTHLFFLSFLFPHTTSHHYLLSPSSFSFFPYPSSSSKKNSRILKKYILNNVRMAAIR